MLFGRTPSTLIRGGVGKAVSGSATALIMSSSGTASKTFTTTKPSVVFGAGLNTYGQTVTASVAGSSLGTTHDSGRCSSFAFYLPDPGTYTLSMSNSYREYSNWLVAGYFELA